MSLRKKSNFDASTLKMSQKKLVMITQRLSDLLSAGISIEKSMFLLSTQMSSPKEKYVTDKLYGSLMKGRSLSESLDHFPKIFSRVYRSVVRSAEMSGEIIYSLKYLKDWLVNVHEVRTKTISSLIYPALVCLMGIITLLVMMVFVVPRIETLSQTSSSKGMVFWITHLMVENISITIMLCLVILVLGVKLVIKSDFILLGLKTPYVGQVITDFYASRLSRILNILFRTGVSVPEIFRTAEFVLPSGYLTEKWKDVETIFYHTGSIGKALMTMHLFDDDKTAVIRDAEEAGFLADAFNTVADQIDAGLREHMKRMSDVLGPVLLVLIVSVIGVVLIKVMLPILQMDFMLE